MVPPSAHAQSILDRLDDVVALDLEVTGASWIAPELRELVLHSDLSGFHPWAGQDLMLSVTDTSGRSRWRRYTVVGVTGDELTLWVTTSSRGPGAAWANVAQPGDRIEAVGPRGKIALNDAASHHVFVVDEAGLAAAHAMAGAVVRGRVHVVAPELDDARLAPTARKGVELSSSRLPSASATSCDIEALREELTRVVGTNGVGSIAGYAFGELHLTREIEGVFLELGLSPAQLAVKAYWRADRANEDRGEPDRG
jgi:NADPH-dependent ferric siderophore reductase